jgi:tetratricopeptide (TPR) repeat protein
MSHVPAPRPARPGAASAPRRIRLWVWLLVVAMIGPCAYVQAPREVGRWYLAAAQVQREAGHREVADRYMARAQSWASDVPGLMLMRAAWLREDGQYETALDVLNDLNERLPDNPAILVERSQVLQHLGRHEEAVADWKSLDRMSLTGGIPSRPMALNGLAYARAVGKLELDDGLKGVEEALTIEPGDPMILDTRGFILYHQGKYEASLADMTAAVVGVEKLFDRPPGEQRIDKQGVAVVRYHRALVLEKLGRFAEAKADRARAKMLIGREPDETLF